MLATQVTSRIARAFEVELPVRALFESPTVAQFAQAVEQRRGQWLPQRPPVLPVARLGPTLACR